LQFLRQRERGPWTLLARNSVPAAVRTFFPVDDEVFPLMFFVAGAKERRQAERVDVPFFDTFADLGAGLPKEARPGSRTDSFLRRT